MSNLLLIIGISLILSSIPILARLYILRRREFLVLPIDSNTSSLENIMVSLKILDSSSITQNKELEKEAKQLMKTFATDLDVLLSKA